MRNRARMSGVASNQRGATLVEHAVVLPLFLVLMVVTFDILRIAYHSTSTHFVAARVIRQASIGNLMPVEIRDELVSLANNLGVPLQNEHISMCRIEEFPCVGVNAGEPQELVALTLNVPTKGLLVGSKFWMTTIGEFELSSTLLITIEPNAY